MRLAPALLALLVLAAPATAHAKGWHTPRVYSGGASEPTPRTAIAGDGTSVTVWTRADGALVSAEGDKRGRFATPRLVTRRASSDFDVAVAPHRRAAVAYEARDGIHIAIRATEGFKETVVPSTGSEINGVQIAADPDGGWVVAERQFINRTYRVRAVSFDGAGKPRAVQDLGEGDFGIDARVSTALGVFANGRAVLAFEGPGGRGVLVSTRPRGGTFGTPVPVGEDLTDPSLTVRGNHGYLGAVRAQSCGDAGCAGAPMLSVIGPDGTASAPVGPQLENPRRAFAASAGPNGLVFSLKSAPKAFSREAGVDWAPPVGAARALTTDLSTEPIALSLHPGTLVLWTTRKGFGAARIVGGRAHRIAAPPGPPPNRFHTNPTNRDFAASGFYAIAAWARDGVVRVSMRRF